jgi:phage terminase large subunit-like protein
MASTLSETSDWSVGTVWGALGLDFYLLELFRERLESPNLRRAIISLHNQHQAAATLIEETELGRALAQDLWPPACDYAPPRAGQAGRARA